VNAKLHQPHPQYHPTYDAKWITWQDKATHAQYVVPMTAPARIVMAATLKPGARTVPSRPQGSEVWHPHLAWS